MRSSIVVLLFAASALFGQISANLSGTVTDQSGSLVPGVTLTATNVETGVQRETQSNDAGFYEFPSLPPGLYSLAAKRAGFRQVVREGLRLEVNQSARIDLAMQVGALTETVEVQAAAPLLETSTSAVGQVIETKAVSDLPLNGRNFLQLAVLANGAIGVGYGPQGTIGAGTRADDTRGGGELMVNGNREMSNDYLLDGVDNNFRRNALITVRPTVESIQEFKMQTNLFGAEQGRNSGATVNVITKNGTNTFHGSAFEFLRNSALDARNFFNAKSTSAKPPYRHNQFGGSLGGPVIHNKLFFFADYQRDRFARYGISMYHCAHYAHQTPDILLGIKGAKRDRDIETCQTVLRHLGKIGVQVAVLDWLPANTFTTAMVEHRGYKTREFSLADFRAKVEKQKFEREYPEEEVWEAFLYYLKAMLPVAEEAKVKLAMHPSDPPVIEKMNGVGRIFRDYEGYRRAEAAAGASKYWGMRLCVGTWAEGGDRMGKNVIETIRDFGGRGKLFDVDFRNVSSPLPAFQERLPDEGYVDMYQVMKTLREVRYAGPMVPDHVPAMAGDQGMNRAGTAYCISSMRALLRRANEEVG